MSAQPPVFRGDPDLSPCAREFAWLDFRRGEGDFRIERNSRTTWKHIGKTSKAGVVDSIHSRQLEDAGGLYEYVLRGRLPMHADTYFVLNADTETRAEWDSTTTSVVELSSSGPSPEAGALKQRERILHWHVKYPWPLGRRDYVFSQTIHTQIDEEGKMFRCIQNRALPSSKSIALRPLEKGVSRVDEYRSNMVIWEGPDDGGKLEACFAVLYFENPKVNLPSWVQSQVAASTIPSSLAAAVPIAEQYPVERIQRTLRRFGIGLPARGDHGCDNQSCDGSLVEDEAFYSASDDEEKTPKPSRGMRSPMSTAATPKPIGDGNASRGMRSPMPTAATPKPIGDGNVRSAARRGTDASVEKDSVDKTDKKRTKRSIASQIVRWSCGEPQKKREDRGEDLEEGLLILSPEERDLLLKVLAETRKRQATAWSWCCPCRRHHKQ
mmetsp:Transcript_52862/g.82422  ORF Transcript_52862/g.82422 Transcript_52862/m.82422 type:complete len:438 (-) Transcript_52862:129-1442(-)